MTRVGILGAGTMGEAMIRGLQDSFEIEASTRSAATAAAVAKKYGVACGTDNVAVAKRAEILVLAVKPHQAAGVLAEIAPALRKGQILVSLCAGLSLSQLRASAGLSVSLVRAMPNTPATVGQAMTVLCSDNQAALKRAEELFSKLGRVAELEESLMDAATGLSGCGPAYVFLMIEALSEAGVKLGIARKTSTLLAAQTLLGAAQMVLERGEHPASLKDEVTTPAGCTVDGLMALEEGNLRVTLIKGVLAAAKRSAKLV